MANLVGEEGYSIGLVNRVSGLSKRQLDYYDRMGIVKPSVKQAEGSGSRRRYSFRDVVELRTIAVLRKQISLQRVRKAVAYLHKNFPKVGQPLAELRFLTDAETIFVLATEQKVWLDALREGQVMISIALGEIIAEVTRQLDKESRSVTQVIKIAGKEFTIDFTPDSEEGGYVAECRELRGAISQGETLTEAREMITDAITMILGVMEMHQDKVRKRRAKA